MADLENAIQDLRGAVTEGRFENVRYRQDQFHALHGALRERSDAICQAIATDSTCSIAEAEAEFYLTMDAVQKSYDLLDFEKSIEQEYIVTKGKNNTERRIGVGFIGIRPQQHSRFYSVVSPLAAALAAGNSILIEVRELNMKSSRSSLTHNSLICLSQPWMVFSKMSFLQSWIEILSTSPRPRSTKSIFRV